MYGSVVKRNKHYYINTQQYVNGERRCSTISVRKYLGLDRPAKSKEAKQVLAKILEDNRQGLYVRGSRKQLAVYLNEWLTHHALTVKRSTASSYKHVVNDYIIPHIGNTALADITPQQIKDWHVVLLKQVSNTTVRYAHTVLKIAFEAATKEGLLQQNVVKLVRAPARVKKQISWLEWSDAERLLEVTKEDRYGLYYAIALSTGMGRSEILGLRWKDIDYNKHVINIRQTYVRCSDGNYFQDSGKTENRLRAVDLGPKLIDRLKQWEEQQKIEMKALGYKTDLVVCSKTGTPVNPSNLQRTITATIKAHNLPHFSTHTLRHTHATKLLSEGMQPKAVAERLGHSVKVLMDTYAHVSPRLSKEAASLTDV
jgi:integrase